MFIRKIPGIGGEDLFVGLVIKEPVRFMFL
jgi:hypothetical protein